MGRAPPRRSRTSRRGGRDTRASPGGDARALWARWIGTSPLPPLDRFLSDARVDRDTFLALTRAAAWAPTVLAALDRRPAPPGGAELVARLRGLAPSEVLAAAAALSGGRAPSQTEHRVGRAVEALRARLGQGWEARCLAHGVPAGFAPRIEAWARAEGRPRVGAWLAAQSSRPPLWVRARDPGAAALLRTEGLSVETHALPGALRVEGERAVSETAAWRSGAIEIQDLASQHAGALALPAPGQRVWDVCAGRGGKAVQLARALAGRGVLHATDTDPRKLDTLRTRVKRAGLADVVRIRPWDGAAVPAFGPEVRGGFDVVLVDAPCSASGTWRRNPDAKLRIEPDTLGRFAPLQTKLLGLGARALGARGRLVYVTCSWAPEENEAVVEAVAAEHGLHIERMSRFGPPELDSDTMFGAVLHREWQSAPRE